MDVIYEQMKKTFLFLVLIHIVSACNNSETRKERTISISNNVKSYTFNSYNAKNKFGSLEKEERTGGLIEFIEYYLIDLFPVRPNSNHKLSFKEDGKINFVENFSIQGDLQEKYIYSYAEGGHLDEINVYNKKGEKKLIFSYSKENEVEILDRENKLLATCSIHQNSKNRISYEIDPLNPNDQDFSLDIQYLNGKPNRAFEIRRDSHNNHYGDSTIYEYNSNEQLNSLIIQENYFRKLQYDIDYLEFDDFRNWTKVEIRSILKAEGKNGIEEDFFIIERQFDYF